MYALTLTAVHDHNQFQATGDDVTMAGKNVLVIATCVVFLVYFANVVAGAAGLGVFLSDVWEMLILFAACICFVVAMLAHERAAAGTDDDQATTK